MVIPKEMRFALGIMPHTPVKIKQVGDTVVISRYEHVCTVCGAPQRVTLGEMLVPFGDRYLCAHCIKGIKQLKGGE